ncbi:hypothetical protein M413DRAFT_23440 [Hebeloma cylindrosporum]|uniref:Uncharacterized protein n=1 Tax=Hebeloma cylindrosporum TaxID=76867 RepID=A0A0C2Z1X3_HEBCY|nr:hypothetical protein M413DRAFT_23440 [Hebeloma cylindrosporum h7]
MEEEVDSSSGIRVRRHLKHANTAHSYGNGHRYEEHVDSNVHLEQEKNGHGSERRSSHRAKWDEEPSEYRRSDDHRWPGDTESSARNGRGYREESYSRRHREHQEHRSYKHHDYDRSSRKELSKDHVSSHEPEAQHLQANVDNGHRRKYGYKDHDEHGSHHRIRGDTYIYPSRSSDSRHDVENKIAQRRDDTSNTSHSRGENEHENDVVPRRGRSVSRESPSASSRSSSSSASSSEEEEDTRRRDGPSKRSSRSAHTSSRHRHRHRSRSRSRSRERSRSKHYHRDDDAGEKRKRKHRHRSESRERKRRKRKEKEKERERERDKEKEKGRNREEERRSVLTGKKIKLKVKKDKGDHERDANRRDLLQFLNSAFE